MGSGKSEAKSIFASFGFFVVDTDKIGHDILRRDVTVRRYLENNFPSDIFDSFGDPDRRKIAKIVFNDSQKLKDFESIMHPLIYDKVNEEEILHNNILVEIPLLFEKKLEKGFDVCVNVICSEAVRLRRLYNRGMSHEEIISRDFHQYTSEEKSRLADVVFLNETTTSFLREQILLFLEKNKK